MTDDALIQQYYTWFNERRFADAAALFTEAADVEFLPGARELGAAGYARFATSWTTAFPDANIAIERIARRGGTAIEVYLLATGTHRGTLDLGMYHFAPSGASVLLHLREFLDIRDGRIAASSLTVDLNDLVVQLTRVDYDELARRLDRLHRFGVELSTASDDPARRLEIAHRLGVELDAARRALRPHYYR